MARDPKGQFSIVASYNATRTEQNFDYVVIAAPLEFTALKFENISIPSIKARYYYHW